MHSSRRRCDPARSAVPYLVYSKCAYEKKQRDSLSDFKENNGFQRIDLPRYYVPLTRIGARAYRHGLDLSVFSTMFPNPLSLSYARCGMLGITASANLLQKPPKKLPLE
jgi:hypothetical protein